jgi:hypothetical protein
MSDLDRLLRLSGMNAQTQTQETAERELKEEPSVPLKKYSNSGDSQGKHDMKKPKHDGSPDDTYGSAPIQDRRRDASKDRQGPASTPTYPNSGDSQGKHDMKVPTDYGSDTYSSAPIQKRRRDASKDRANEAVGEFAEPIYKLCDEIGCDSDHPIFAELVRYMSGDQIKDFVADYRRHHEMNDMEDEAEVESIEPTEPSKEEGNKFSGELADAKKDGKKEFDVDGKKYKVEADAFVEDEAEVEPTEENIEEATGKCKDCGCIIDNPKPGCDCPNDVHDASQDNWVKEANRIKELAGINTISDIPVEEAPVEEAPVEEAPAEEANKSIKVDKLIPIAGDSIWDKEGNNPKQIKVDSISITNPYEEGSYMDDEEDDGYRTVNVEHDGPWSIYTDSGFEKAISEMVGFEVDFTEQGMQEDGMASMEGMMDDKIKSEAFANYKPNRFKDMPKGMNEAPTMDTTQLITLMKNSGLSEEAIQLKLNEWANTPAEGASEDKETSHGEPYENFAQSVNLSLKKYLDAEDFKVGLKEHKVDEIKEAYKKSKKAKKDKK